TKSASSVVVEFTRPEDANKVIDEGLIWQGEVFQCELYDRQCRAQAASKSRPRYHLELESFVARTTTGIRTRDRQNESNPIARTGRPTLEPGRPRDANSSRSRSPTKKQQKRANCSNNQITPDNPRNEIVVNIGSQRPRRTLAPSRRVLETLDSNRQITQHSQQMEVDDQE
ncbi:hypothetical protein DER44DRAFT_634172, partial [Fusarium oxysporum]